VAIENELTNKISQDMRDFVFSAPASELSGLEEQYIYIGDMKGFTGISAKGMVNGKVYLE